MKSLALRNLTGFAAIAVCLVSGAGCAGRQGTTTTTLAQAPTPAPSQLGPQAQEQAVMNNPRLSPAMKAMIVKQIEKIPPPGQAR